MLRAVNARKALVLLSLVVLTAVGYIEDPRNEGTETRTVETVDYF